MSISQIFELPNLERNILKCLKDENSVAIIMHWLLFRVNRMEKSHIINFHGEYDIGQCLLTILRRHGILYVEKYPGQSSLSETGICIIPEWHSAMINITINNFIKDIQSEDNICLIITYTTTEVFHPDVTNIKLFDSTNDKVITQEVLLSVWNRTISPQCSLLLLNLISNVNPNTKPIILNFYGNSRSGKTTIIKSIENYLTEIGAEHMRIGDTINKIGQTMYKDQEVFKQYLFVIEQIQMLDNLDFMMETFSNGLMVISESYKPIVIPNKYRNFNVESRIINIECKFK